MKQIKDPIKFNEVSYNVANLHLALEVLLPKLGFHDFKIPEEELQARQALAGTVEAVLLLREKWNLHQQSDPLVAHPELMAPQPEVLLDATLAEKINQALEKFYTVEGRVTFPNGLGLEGHQVTLSEYDLEGGNDLQKTITNADGTFQFVFDYSKELKRGDGGTELDLWMQVTAPDGIMPPIETIFLVGDGIETAVSRLADSPIAPIVLMNVPKEITVRIVPVQKEIRLTEFERLVALLSPFMGERHFADLKEDDKNFQISFLSKESDVEKASIEMLKHAFSEERSSGIAAWAFFELANLPLPVSEWNNKTTEELAAVLKPLQPHASDENLIELAQKLQDYSKEINIGLEVFKLQEVSGKLIKSVLQSDEKTQRFFDHYARHEGDIEAFWNKMEAQDEFREQVPEIQLTLQLSQLTLGNTGLVGSLKEKGIKDTKELVSYSHGDWKSMILLHPAGIPIHIEAETEDEKANSYATELQTLVEVVFPTEVIKQQSNSEDLKAFLNQNSGFDFTQHAVDHYIKSSGMVWPEGVNKEKLVMDLRQTQRLYSITASAADSQTLSSMGYTSAFQISKMPMNDFVLTLSGKIGFDDAAAYHAKAVAVTEATTFLHPQMRELVKAASPISIGTVLQEDANMILPNWENLFGQIETCECEHCKSVYSPAAYFVDLLHILLGQGDGKARKEIFRRRPDLKYTKLSCEHTDTLMPYIDLVNEILENYVAQDNINNATATDLHAVDATVDSSALSEAELAANPQHPNEKSQKDATAAYQKISEAFYPLNLPFDLSLETVREFLLEQNSSRYELMKTFGNQKDEDACHAEGLGLSVFEYEILAGMHKEKQADNTIILEDWTVDDFYQDTASNLRTARVFLDATKINYADLIALVKTQFLNADKNIVLALNLPPANLSEDDKKLWEVANACNLKETSLEHKDASLLTDAELINFNRFMRLWKKMGCTIEELDMMLCAVDTSSSKIFTTGLLNDLSKLWKFQHKHSMSAEQGAVLVNNIPTHSENSLYQRLFLNKAILQIDDKFELDDDGKELKNATEILGNHIPAFLAAFQLKENDLNDIADFLGLDLKITNAPNRQNALSLYHISLIYRVILFAKKNGIKIHDLFLLKAMLPKPKWNKVNNLIENQAFIDKIKAHDFKAPALAYLFGDIVEQGDTFPPKDEVVDQSAKDLTQGLSKIENALKVDKDTITADFLRSQMGQLIDNEKDLNKFISILDGSIKDEGLISDVPSPKLSPFAVIDATFILSPPVREEYKMVIANFLSTADVNAISSKDTIKDRYWEFWINFENEWKSHLKSTFIKQHLVAKFNADASIIAFVFPFIETTIESQHAVVYKQLFKFLWLVKKLKLDSKELAYLQYNGTEFDGFDWGNFTTAQLLSWLRVAEYCKLRNSFAKSDKSLISIFEAAPIDLEKTIVAATGYSEENVNSFVSNYANGNFKNELLLLLLQRQVICSDTLGVELAKLREWAVPIVNGATAQNIKQTLKAKYDEASWVDVSSKVHNTLRNQQRDALVAYLLQSKAVKALNLILVTQSKQPITSANALYAYFLIDVEMDAVMKTSRLKQAIASVQLFTQRCIMNLEFPTVSPLDIDAKQWAWMRNYRVWEANRKVFLYPENWIEPELRDGKSPFFKELESELLQGEVTTERVETAIQNYLYKLDDVARLDICGTYEDSEANELHVFGRTFNNPPIYYYRKLNLKDHEWTPWEKVQLDIQGNDEGENAGVHLIPVVWNRRLYLFWPVFTEIPLESNESNLDSTSYKYWNIKMAWSQLIGNKWSNKKLSQQSIKVLNESIVVSFGSYNANYIFRKTTITSTNVHSHRFIINQISDEIVIKIRVIKSSRIEKMYTNENMTLVQFKRKLESGDIYNVNINVAYQKDDFDELGYFKLSSCNGLASVVQYKNPYHILDRDKIIDSKINYQNDKLSEPFKELQINLKKPELILNKSLAPYCKISRSNFLSGDTFYKFFYQDANRNYYAAPRREWYIKRAKGMMNKKEIVIPNYVNIAPIRAKDAGTSNNLRIAPRLGVPAINAFVHDGTLSQANAMQMTVQLPNTAISISNHLKSSRSKTISEKYFTQPSGKYLAFKIDFKVFFHPYVCSMVKALHKDGVDGLLTMSNQKLTDTYLYAVTPGKVLLHTNFEEYYQPNEDNVWKPYPSEDIDFSLNGAYSTYNWELFFHIPMLLANRLSKNQKFEEAMRWYQFIFDPTTNDAESSEIRYWQVLPLRNTPKKTLEALMQQLNHPKGDPRRKELEDAITKWRNNPFNPHLIARMRLIAYQKNVLMKYLDNLLAWADNLFRQDTMEQINQATQLYIMAAELLGKRPEKIPARGNIVARSYGELETAGLNAFSNAQVQMETLFPFFNLENIQTNNGETTTILRTSIPADYFCLPDNPKLLAYWDTIADRLFKIRHSLNIEGVERQLPLFEPPIDPALLVQAFAQGLDINSILADLNAPLPYFRFGYIVQKALEICNELKSLGSTLLSVMEKKDNEALSMMRSEQEKTLMYLSKTVRKLQIKESQLNRDGLEKTWEVTQHRFAYYVNLIAKGLTDSEKEQQENLNQSHKQGLNAHQASQISSTLHYYPNITIGAGTPSTSFGGSNLGSAAQAVAEGFRMNSSIFAYFANLAQINAGHERRKEEWIQQKELAEKELKQIDKQIFAAKIRERIAYQELTNLEQQIDNSNQVLDFMRNKYTQEELYGWMQGEISTLYFQCYQLAYDLAKKAERTYRHELGIETSNFVQFGIWDSFRKGLMSGERLYLSLKQMEKAYMDQNRREYEITKHISIAQLDPLAIIKLRETGICDFEVPEALYDMDYPGQYFRRIKSVSISIPCIAGPYTSVSSKLSLLKSRYRKKADFQPPYPEKLGNNDDDRFVYNLGSLQSIATSHGQNDSGVFELNFRDERYLPFEYAGAISTWRLELPTEVKQFDYNTISDVVIHVKYTAREGGSSLKDVANKAIKIQLEAIKQGLKQNGMHIALNMKHGLPNEWHLFKKTGKVEVLIDKSRFPYMIQPFKAKIKNVMFFAKTNENPTLSRFLIKVDENDTILSFDNNFQLCKGTYSDIELGKKFTIFVQEEDKRKLEDLILVVNYEFPTPI